MTAVARVPERDIEPAVLGEAADWLVLLQSVLSFAFNTAILAFTINIAASLF